MNSARWNGSRDCVFILDKDGVIQDVNQNGAKLFNRAKVFLIGKCAFDFFPVWPTIHVSDYVAVIFARYALRTCLTSCCTE